MTYSRLILAPLLGMSTVRGRFEDNEELTDRGDHRDHDAQR